MFNRDSDFLARLIHGSASPDDRHWDLSQLSTAFQPVAIRLLVARPDERAAIWEEFLAAGARSAPMSDAARTMNRSAARGAAPEATIPPVSLHPAAPALDESRVKPQRHARLTCAADIKPLDVQWLWNGRVPLGMLTMFAGDPKLGKSFVALDMAAALSRGLPMPMSVVPPDWRPGSSILMSAEDDPSRTIVHRLTASGADMGKVHVLDSVILANGSEAFPSLRTDIDAITAAAATLGDCRLIVIDPVSAYLTGVDDNRNAVLRGVLSPLKTMAEQLGAAVVLINHLSKRSSANGKHRVLGSIAYVGACRANHLFVLDPDDLTGRRVLMLDNGGNLAERAPTLAYVIEDGLSGPHVEWHPEPVSITVEQALRPGPRSALAGGQAAQSLECDNWLRTCLAERHRSTIDVFRAGITAGFSRDQIRRAKYRIGVVALKAGFGNDGQWTWGLHGNAPTP